MKIKNIGILTCNSPDQLARCLDGFIAHLRDHGRSARFSILDDSADPAMRERNLAILSARAADAEIRYAGQDEKRSYLEALARETAVEPALLRFILGEYPYAGYRDGGNRNALFLEMAGERFLSSDDDIVCRVSAGADDAATLPLSTAPDPAPARIFATAEELLAACPAAPVDLLSRHERWLGTPTPDGGTIRLTVGGFYGDPGVRFPTFYLWSGERAREQLIADPARYRQLMLARQIHKAPAETCVSRGGHFQTTGPSAFDATGPLPPFLPVMRGSDLLFSQAFRSCLTQGRMAYLSVSVHHSPLKPRINTLEGMMEQSARFTLPSLMRTAIDGYRPREEDDAPTRLEGLSAHLVRLGGMAEADFDAAIRDGITRFASGRIEALTQLLDRHGRSPDFWARDIEDFIAAVRAQLSLPRFHWPADVEPAGAALGTAQDLIGRYGRVIQAWPEVFRGAIWLKQAGKGLGRKIG